jgi:hypothetical protein
MEFNSSKGYRTIQTKTKDWLRVFDFKSHGTNTVYRLKHEALQFLNFQKGVGHLSGQMTVNIVVKGIFTPGCGFETLQPGGRIGNFIPGLKDKWWPCDSPDMTADSVNDIIKILESSVIPFYEKFGSTESILSIATEQKFSFLWENPLTFIDKGFFYLYLKKYEEALSIFESRQPSRVPKFKTIKNLFDQKQFEAIDRILIENTLFNTRKLKI